MNTEEFRRAGHQLIDWVADYKNSVKSKPVRAQINPGDVKRSFDNKPPSNTCDFETLLNELEHKIIPAITQVQHPMYYGWFPSNASLSSILGDIASSGLSTLGITWESCPALTETEEVVCDWMRQLVGLSNQWHGVIQDTASTATTVCLLSARERATNYAQNQGGIGSYPSPLTVYCTAEAHSSVVKAALLAGYGKSNIRVIAVESTRRTMQPEQLQSQLEEDINNGFQPAAIIATSGTTGVTAFDPLEPIAQIANQHSCWLHVDAAMGGSAMLLPECRHLWQGIERADSLCWNPHKWMGTILDCSLMYVKDPEHLIRVMSTNPSYLRSKSDGEVTQYRDWGIPLGRRFRSLKILFQLRLDGVESIQQRLRKDISNAKWLSQQIEQHPDWYLVAPTTLQTVCIRHQPANISDDEVDKRTLQWLEKINASGLAFMSPSQMEKRWYVRVSIGSQSTTLQHVEQLWAILQKAVN